MEPRAWAEPRAALVRRLMKRFSCGSDVLDIGCGNGRQWTENVTGVDISPEAVLTARQKGLKTFLGNACDLPETGLHDTVLLLDVLEHVDNERAALLEASRALRPGGFLIVSVPLYPSLWSYHDERLHHKKRYRPGEIPELVREAGFSVVYATRWNGLGLVGALFRKAGFAIEKATTAARPFLEAEAWLGARTPLPVGLSEFILAQKSRQERIGQAFRPSCDQFAVHP